MSVSVDNIQRDVAAIVDQDEDTSNISSADYSLRLSFINSRERTWAEVGKWDVLYKDYHTLTSTSSGNTSISLPDDFRRLASFPRVGGVGVVNDQFPEINPTNRGQWNPAADNYVEILGNAHTGYDMVVNVGTIADKQIASGASIHVPYYSVPTSLASPADVITCPNSEYIVRGVVADVWESRVDARFQQAKAEANLILQNMLEFQLTPSQASDELEVRTVDRTKHGFRWGK